MTTLFGGLCERAFVELRICDGGRNTSRGERGRKGEREGGKCANIGIFPFYRPNGKKPPIFQFPPWNTRNATGIRVYREGPFEM